MTLKEIRERAEKATESRCWEWEYSEDGGVYKMELSHVVIDASENDGMPGAHNDMDFIAHARTDIPDLLQALDDARPVMEWMAEHTPCRRLNYPMCGNCEPCQARAWIKKHGNGGSK